MSTTLREPSPISVAAPRRRNRTGLSLQSILLIMLLVVSILSNVVIGIIGYLSGTDSLRDAAVEKLVEIRNARARGIADLFGTIESSMLIHSKGESVRGASEAFNSAFAALDEAELSPTQNASLDAYYRDEFGPALEAALGEPVDVSTFVPTGAAQRYLQYNYIASTHGFDDAVRVTDPGDGSDWSGAHARYHEYFASMVEQLDYQDLLLVDVDGNVVYSVFKGTDLGTNLLTGPFSMSNLATAFKTTLSDRLLDSVEFTDFENHLSSIGDPAAWAVSLISQGGEVTGALVVEMPIERITRVMTSEGNWESSGLGSTGEAYLVGHDSLMRSPSRLLIEDPDSYAAAATRMGGDAIAIERAVARSDSLLLQPVTTEAVQRAQRGESGTVVAPNYLGTETIAAYAPLAVEGLGWTVIAEVATSEAFAPVSVFTTQLFISSAILVLIVSLLSLLLAQMIVRPLTRLRIAAERISAGEVGVEVDAGSADELASLANSFNEMSRSLQVKADLLEKQRVENNRLLRSLMPETLARRYLDGDVTLAEEHHEVAVLYAEILGFDEFVRSVDGEQAFEILNEIVDSFDSAARQFGVERVRTSSRGYLASCGLTVPRMDAARRIVDFTSRLVVILDRFDGRFSTNLQLRAGIDFGTVSSGLIGRESVAFDIWGDAANFALRAQGKQDSPGIYVSDGVRERLADSSRFVDAGQAESDGRLVRIWRLEQD